MKRTREQDDEARSDAAQRAIKRFRIDQIEQTAMRMTICSRWLTTILQFYNPRVCDEDSIDNFSLANYRPLVQVDIVGYRVKWGQKYTIGMEVHEDGSGLTLCDGDTPFFLLGLRVPDQTVLPVPLGPNISVCGMPRHIARVNLFVCRRYELRPAGTTVGGHIQQ